MNSNPFKLDRIDRQIIFELQKNGRVSYKEIARRLDVSDGTVRFRTERMISKKLLRISASINPFFFENSIMAAVGMTLARRNHQVVMQKISSLAGVRSVSNLTGRYDLWVEVFFDSRRELRKFLIEDLSEFDEITATETFIFLEALDKWVEFPEPCPQLPPPPAV